MFGFLSSGDGAFESSVLTDVIHMHAGSASRLHGDRRPYAVDSRQKLPYTT